MTSFVRPIKCQYYLDSRARSRSSLFLIVSARCLGDADRDLDLDDAEEELEEDEELDEDRDLRRSGDLFLSMSLSSESEE